MAVQACGPSYMRGIGRRLCSDTNLGEKRARSHLKTEAERAGGVAQVLEHLPSKHEALRANLVPKKKKKKRKERKRFHIYICFFMYIFWNLSVQVLRAKKKRLFTCRSCERPRISSIFHHRLQERVDGIS
jgi:hypothetical protein